MNYNICRGCVYIYFLKTSLLDGLFAIPFIPWVSSTYWFQTLILTKKRYFFKDASYFTLLLKQVYVILALKTIK